MRYIKYFESNFDLDNLISIAKNVCDNYPQEWGDCYKINSTVAYWINKNLGEWRMRIYQVRAELDCEIYDDEETGYTDEPYHVIVVDGHSKSDLSENGNFHPDRESKWYDFSNVFVGEREAEIVDIIYESELGGEVDDDLLVKLNGKL